MAALNDEVLTEDGLAPDHSGPILLIACGAAAGISAVFNAPFGTTASTSQAPTHATSVAIRPPLNLNSERDPSSGVVSLAHAR